MDANGTEDTRGSRRKFRASPRQPRKNARALSARYLRSSIRRTGWAATHPAMHLSIVKLSRFVRMMDRSPGRRNLAQFVTRANLVAGSRSRESSESSSRFARRACKRTEQRTKKKKEKKNALLSRQSRSSTWGWFLSGAATGCHPVSVSKLVASSLMITSFLGRDEK